MKFLDLFAGIGGFRLGMEMAGHECVGFCEVDVFARKSYKAIFNTEKEVELHDIRSVPDESIRGLGRVDILCGGFPCQSFSLAGSRRGFRDERGNLFFEVTRFAKLLRPSYIFLENVPGLLSHGGGDTFETILSTLDALGYNVEWQVLNSSHFGVPQNRQRVFLVGHSRRRGTRPIFPLGSYNREVAELPKIGNVHPSGKGMNGDVYSAEGTAPTLTTNKGEGMKIVLSGRLPGKYSITNRVYDTSGIAPTLSTMQGGGQEPKIIQRSHGFNKGGVVMSDFRIRKLTPRECWRLQGFPDWAFNRAEKVNSNSQLYKQAGNSVTVPVIAAIARQLQ